MHKQHWLLEWSSQCWVMLWVKTVGQLNVSGFFSKKLSNLYYLTAPLKTFEYVAIPSYITLWLNCQFWWNLLCHSVLSKQQPSLKPLKGAPASFKAKSSQQVVMTLIVLPSRQQFLAPTLFNIDYWVQGTSLHKVSLSWMTKQSLAFQGMWSHWRNHIMALSWFEGVKAH